MPGNRPKHGNAAIIKALDIERGNLAAVARRLGYQRPSIWRRVNGDDELRAHYQKLQEEYGRADRKTVRKERKDQKVSIDDIEFELRRASGSLYHAAKSLGIRYDTLRDRIQVEPELQKIVEIVRAEQFGEAIHALRLHVRDRRAPGNLVAINRSIDLYAPKEFRRPVGMEVSGPGGTPLFIKQDPKEATIAAAALLEQLEKWEGKRGVTAAMPAPEDPAPEDPEEA